MKHKPHTINQVFGGRGGALAEAPVVVLDLVDARRLETGKQLHRNMQRFGGGLVFKAHRLLYHSTLGLRVIKKTRRQAGGWLVAFIRTERSAATRAFSSPITHES